jgi:hypothetical protein
MDQQTLREQLLFLLGGGGAHVDVAETVRAYPWRIAGGHLPGVAHSPWQLLEHMRIAQWDILEYCRNPAHVSPPWPDGYWPAEDAPAGAAAWRQSVATLCRELAEMQALVADPGTDLLRPFAHGEGGHTILREALLVADHNAYHLGQLVVLRQGLGGGSRHGRGASQAG